MISLAEDESINNNKKGVVNYKKDLFDTSNLLKEFNQFVMEIQNDLNKTVKTNDYNTFF